MSEHDDNSVSDSAALPRCVFTPNAPPPVGHYCQGVVAGGFVFVSGQGGLRSDGGLIPGGAGPQARQAITNIAEILKAAHPRLTLRNVTRVTIYYTDIEKDASAVNAVYKEMFSFGIDPYKPARMVFQVAKQPIPDARVSIDAQALLPG
jgi:2-iminobutanoate/2-iminopropanoate deaminase